MQSRGKENQRATQFPGPVSAAVSGAVSRGGSLPGGRGALPSDMVLRCRAARSLEAAA